MRQGPLRVWNPKAPFTLFLAAATLLVAGDGQTIKTTDGAIYTNATITELRPSGAVISSETGIVTVAYAKLPNELRARYEGNSGEVAEHVKRGIDGIYTYHETVVPLGGEEIELKNGQFTYYAGGDVPSANTGPLQGRFTIVGNWLILHQPKLQLSPRVIAVVDDRLALFTAHEFKRWKDSGVLPRSEILFRRKSK